MDQALVHRFRVLGYIVSGIAVCRRTGRGGLWAGIGMAGGGMCLDPGMVVGVGGDEEKTDLRRQAVGVRPSRLLNSTVAAPLFTGLRQAQHTIRGSQPLALWPHQSVADCFDWLGPAWEIVITLVLVPGAQKANRNWSGSIERSAGGTKDAVAWLVSCRERTEVVCSGGRRNAFCAHSYLGLRPPVVSLFGPLAEVGAVAGSKNPPLHRRRNTALCSRVSVVRRMQKFMYVCTYMQRKRVLAAVSGKMYTKTGMEETVSGGVAATGEAGERRKRRS